MSCVFASFNPGLPGASPVLVPLPCRRAWCTATTPDTGGRGSLLLVLPPGSSGPAQSEDLGRCSTRVSASFPLSFFKKALERLLGAPLPHTRSDPRCRGVGMGTARPSLRPSLASLDGVTGHCCLDHPLGRPNVAVLQSVVPAAVATGTLAGRHLLSGLSGPETLVTLTNSMSTCFLVCFHFSTNKLVL